MDGKALHRLVVDWPIEVWPQRIVWCDGYWSDSHPDAHSCHILNENAVLMFEASGQAHLETIFENVTVRRGAEVDIVCRVFKSDEEVTGTGPTKIEAVAAAIRAATGQEKK